MTAKECTYVFIYFLFQTNLGGQHNAYHGFFYVEEHPPPPPPHAYELQQGYHPQTHQMVAYPQGKKGLARLKSCLKGFQSNRLHNKLVHVLLYNILVHYFGMK